jgi:hypothetical protein
MGDYYIVFSISIISLLFLMVNSILFLSKNKKKNAIYKMLTLYLVAMAIVESVCNYIGFFKPGNNIFVSHIYFNAQFLFLSVLFYRLFTNSFLKRIIIINIIVVWGCLSYQYIANPSLFWNFNLFEILTISFILIVYALINLWNCLDEKKYYYFSIGLIMYLLCSSIIFMSGNLDLVFVEKPYIDIWIFNSLLYIVYQLLILKEWKIITK